MTLSSALSNALSGLNANSRTAEVLSGNVANALTEGYAGRDVVLSARSPGGVGAGVSVEGVARRADPRATADRRAADALSGAAAAADAGQTRLAAIFGGPDDAGSLPSRATALETTLANLADAPESTTLQASALAAAKTLARAFNTASDAVQSVREDADAAAGRLIDTLNGALASVDRLNREIVAERSAGQAAGALIEERDRMVDRIGAIVPTRIAQRRDGEIALYAPGGAVLLEGEPAVFGFAPAGQITADMTLASGALSPVTLNGRALRVGAGDGPLDGGALSAQIALRDVAAPEAAAQLDALALDLIERFADPAVDPTLAPGAPGLFSDAGAYPDPADQAGLAGRLTVSAAVDPAEGGELRRLRDGLGSVTAGVAGEDDLLRAMLTSMTAARPASADTGLSGDFGLSGVIGGAASLRLSAAAGAEDAAAFAAGRRSALAEAESAAIGVDTDDELSKLLLVEQAYAANARVIRTMDDLLRLLMEI